MSTDVLTRVQENKLKGLEELIDAYHAAAATEGGADATAAIADFIVDEGIGVRQASRHVWDYNWTRALAGLVPDRRERGAQLRSLLERAGQLLVRGATVARRYADLSGGKVARLAQFEEQAQAFPLWVEECMARWELLDRPRKPPDRERVARSRAAFAQGEGEDVADILARLGKGGSLGQE